MSKINLRVVANATDPTPALAIVPGDQVIAGDQVKRVVAVKTADELHTEITLATLHYDGYGEDFDAYEWVDDPFVVPDTRCFNVIRILKVTTKTLD